MKEITPPSLRCAAEDACPAVFEDGEDLVIIGKAEPVINTNLERRVQPGESVIRIDRKFFSDLKPAGQG